MPIEPEIERLIRDRLAQSEFANWFGFRLVGVGDGESEIRMDVSTHHLNPGKIAHGGVFATLIDAAIGIAIRSRLPRGNEHVTVHLDVQYLKPAREGTTVIARGRSVHRGSRTGYGEADLHDDEGRLLAKGSATFLVIPASWGGGD